MGQIIHLPPTGANPIIRNIDASFLVFDSMSDIRCRVASVAHRAEDRATVSRVLCIVAKMLVSQMIAQPGTRILSAGMSFHHAGKRAIELLDLAQELDEASLTKGGA